jgi:hypothetical protein
MSHLNIAPGSLLCLAIATLMSGCAGGPPLSPPPLSSLPTPSAAPASSVAVGAQSPRVHAAQPAAAPVPASIYSCNDLRAEIAEVERAKHAAEQAGDDAWKAVVPLAVIARFAKGKKAAVDAAERLAQLEAAADRRGCARS